jgi:hypothetical protein
MAQHSAFLVVVALLALKNIIEDAESLLDVWPFVEHDALGALAHRCIGDLGARRDSVLGQSFQNLGGPNYRYMGGLTDP